MNGWTSVFFYVAYPSANRKASADLKLLQKVFLELFAKFLMDRFSFFDPDANNHLKPASERVSTFATKRLIV
jgi:hypothetical protein